jgi:acyl-CoA synthetase (AMP-forming)/AMP-acid ligase II
MATTLASSHVVRSSRPTPDIPDVSLDSHVLAGGRPADLAMIDAASGRSLTFAALAEAVAGGASGLAARGVRRGDVVCLQAPNVPEWPVAFHAVLRAGGAVMAASPLAPSRELARQLKYTDARALITVPALLDGARAAAIEAGVDEVIVLGEAPGAMSFSALSALTGGQPSPPRVDPSAAAAALLWSSGTTGLPKAVELSHRNLVANLVQNSAPMGVRPHHRMLGLAPFFHAMGLTPILNLTLSCGAAVVTMARFDLEGMLAAIEQHRITHAIVPPPVGLALSRHPLVERYDLSSLEMLAMGAAPVSAQLERDCERRLGCRVGQGYGMTETSAVIAIYPAEAPERAAPGSCGELLGGTDAIVVDPHTGERLAPGSEGEIRVRGPQVMRGYRDNPEATAATLIGDWLCTGDLGRVSADGVVEVTDRLKELIKYKGHQVAPAQLEALLATHPAVVEAGVVGVPDDEAGELPVAYVVAANGVDPEKLVEWVAERVAPYERIRRVEVVEELPRSPTGKLLRRVLRERKPA